MGYQLERLHQRTAFADDIHKLYKDIPGNLPTTSPHMLELLLEQLKGHGRKDLVLLLLLFSASVLIELLPVLPAGPCRS